MVWQLEFAVVGCVCEADVFALPRVQKNGEVECKTCFKNNAGQGGDIDTLRTATPIGQTLSGNCQHIF